MTTEYLRIQLRNIRPRMQAIASVIASAAIKHHVQVADLEIQVNIVIAYLHCCTDRYT